MLVRQLGPALLLLFAACGGSDAGAGSGGGGGGGDSGGPGGRALPDICQESAAEAARCESVPGLPRGVVCQGAPTELITDHHCDYQTTAVGVGNVYCCP